MLSWHYIAGGSAQAKTHPAPDNRLQAWRRVSTLAIRVIQFSTEPLTGRIKEAIKRFDPREGFPGKAPPYTSQNAWMELRRWYHSHVR